MVLLENVRNIAGPRHQHEWDVIIRSLRELGYQVSSEPIVFSPHLLPPERGGRPQVRERVFIAAVQVGADAAKSAVPPAVPRTPIDDWLPGDWDLDAHLPLVPDAELRTQLGLRLTASEASWLDAWDDFITTFRAAGVEKLPGFPVWVDAFVETAHLQIPAATPEWKANFLRKNAEFYTAHKEAHRRLARSLGISSRLPAITTKTGVAGSVRINSGRHHHSSETVGAQSQACHVCTCFGGDNSDHDPRRPTSTAIAPRSCSPSGPARVV